MDLVRAIERYCTAPCIWSVGDELVSLEWAEGNPLPKPTQQDLDAAWAECLLDRLRQHAAAKRYAVETGGIWVGGMFVLTDRDSQNLIQGARALSVEEPDEPVEFKASSGWITIDAATIQGIALAVGRHVRACFAAERLVSAAIDAGTITTPEQIDAAPWPQALT